MICTGVWGILRLLAELLAETVCSQISAPNICRIEEPWHIVCITVNHMDIRQCVIHSACCCGFFFFLFLLRGGRHLSRQCFNVAQHTCATCGHMQPRPPLNVIWSQMHPQRFLWVFTPLPRSICPPVIGSLRTYDDTKCGQILTSADLLIQLSARRRIDCNEPPQTSHSGCYNKVNIRI